MHNHVAIACTRVRFRFPSSVERAVTIEVSAPFCAEGLGWRCELDLRGLEDEATAMLGDDSLGALSAALLYLRMRIEHYRGNGVRVLYSQSDEDFLLDAYFPPRLVGWQ